MPRRRGALALAAALLCLLATTSIAAAQDVETYLMTLSRAADALRAPEPDPATAAEMLAGVGSVTVAGGAPVEPDLSAILADLRASPPDIKRALARIEAAISAIERASLSSPGDDDALSALDAVLARSEFAPPEPDDGERSWRQRLVDALDDVLSPVIERIARWLSPLFDSEGGSSAGGVVLRAIMAAIGIAAIVAVIVLVIRNVRQAMTSDIARLEAARETRLSAADARANAEQLFLDGNFREALRALYLATLLRLDETGRLRFDRSLTNQEVLRATRIYGDETLRQRLSPLVDRFDRVWYGGASCSADDYLTFSRLADVVWETQA
ncbi:MAG TPA: DUF4129 domain-containing protein [Thermomicrobiales bacterium]|nr:DUF4129 domain-containing protein [Thermomicrobiales bacterium]